MQHETPPFSAPDIALEILEEIERREAEISQTLHDTLCQSLGGAAVMVKVLVRRAAGGDSIAAADLEQVAEMLDRSLEASRAVSFELQPLQTGPRALMSGLDRLAAATKSRTPCDFQCEEPIMVENRGTALALFRFAREAVRNALRSAQATRILISLTAPEGRLTVSISDNGQASSMDQSLLRCLAAAADGEFRSESAVGGGSIMTCSLPESLKHL